MICLKLATRTGSFQVEVDATPADCGVANINYERKPLAVPGTWNTGTNYADSRYQLPQIDNPDERELEDALGSRTGTKNLTVHSYDIHATIGLSESVPENRGEQFFDVGIGEGESRFQAFTQWPEAEEFHFPGLERLKAKKGPLRKRFTTQDLADCAHLFGLDPFNRDFLTGRATLINAGYPLAQAYGSSAIFDYPEHTWDREHERSEG